MAFCRSLVSAIFICVVYSAVAAVAAIGADASLGDTGKIAGRVVDATSGEALIGVNVLLSTDGEDTITGTVTDSDGYYSMINIKPGTYQVIFSYIGYQTQRTENVKVIVDRTTTIDVDLAEAVIEGEEVIITAERPLIEFDRTTTTAVVDSDQLEALPVVGIDDVINLQAGVVDGHFRGGRIGEVSYLVNGVPINNAFTNTASFTVEQNMVESLEVISGVFNAEYGQALSGVVNIVTKDVPKKWSGSVLGYAGSIVSNRELEFVERTVPAGNGLSASDFVPTFVSYTDAADIIGRQDAQINIGGPLIKEKLGVRFTGRFFYDEGSSIGRRLFAPSDSSQNLNSGRAPDTWILQSSGDQSFVPSRSWRYSFNASAVYNIHPNLQLDYNLFWQDARSRGYNQNRKYVPDGNNWIMETVRPT